MTTPPAEGDQPVASQPQRPHQSMGGAAGLVLLAVAGHVCSLLLIDVRPYAMFQHYRTWTWIASGRSIPAWGALAQTVIVASLLWRHRARLRTAAGGVLSVRASLVVVALAGFSLAVPTESASRVAGELILAGALALVAALNLVLAVLMLPDSAVARAEAWVDARVTLRAGATDARRWDRYLPAVVALWIVVLAAVANRVVLEGLPHIDDSVSNLFQAKYFATGRLYLPPPPDTQSFQVDQTIVEPAKWYGYAFPGWPAVLALGVAAGVPWLVNPVLGGMLILLGHVLLRRRFDRGTANAAILALAVSPWLIYMSAEFMPHPVTGVLAVSAAIAFDRASDRGPRWLAWAALAGIASGALMLTRAIDGALVMAALGLAVLFERRFLRALPATAVAGIVAAAVSALVLPYNQAVTGRATYPPHMAWSDGHWGPGVDRLGFGPDIGIRAFPNLDPLPGHGIADVILNANKNMFMSNVELFGWAAGSMLLVWIAFGIGRWRREDGLLLALPVSFVLGYSAYWFSGGPDLGPRYWYPLMIPFAALTVRGAQMLTARLRELGQVPHPGARVVALLAIASASAAVATLPWRAVTKHYRYRGISGEVRELAAANRFEHALVFLRAGARDYQSAFSLNPSTFDDPGTIYARDAGPEHRAAVLARFPDRPVWVIGRDSTDSDAQGPFYLIAGPLAPGTNPP